VNSGYRLLSADAAGASACDQTACEKSRRIQPQPLGGFLAYRRRKTAMLRVA